ncbi:DUF2141 domain-containing protein [Chitinimonas sp. BJYL2]|uniref:DUF2141 domain-containing protein n=1 Tax=Chitinimonas sp. BJYL2 TaxID=2976696 RepID=UPI0022B3BB83|nr:DUF2141 domain-containing protein [Chitinimonas sp. BJYL2]
MKALTLTTLILLASQATAAELRIDIAGLQTREGSVLVAAYDQAEGFLKKPVAYALADATNPQPQAVFANLPAGDYAISLFHDINGNRKLDKNLVGMPTEPYGFSNDAAGQFGPPSFEQARLSLPDNGKTIAITLR